MTTLEDLKVTVEKSLNNLEASFPKTQAFRVVGRVDQVTQDLFHALMLILARFEDFRNLGWLAEAGPRHQLELCKEQHL